MKGFLTVDGSLIQIELPLYGPSNILYKYKGTLPKFRSLDSAKPIVPDAGSGRLIIDEDTYVTYTLGRVYPSIVNDLALYTAPCVPSFSGSHREMKITLNNSPIEEMDIISEPEDIKYVLKQLGRVPGNVDEHMVKAGGKILLYRQQTYRMTNMNLPINSMSSAEFLRAAVISKSPMKLEVTFEPADKASNYNALVLIKEKQC